MHAFRLGRIFGIDIRIDWSWLFIVVLLIWSLTTTFAQWHPGWATGESLVVAVASALLFFTCILLHELAHSLVASTFGLRVRSITLFLFGGVSNIEHELPSPRAEFFTAIAGPIASLCLGLWFVFLAIASTTISFDFVGVGSGGIERLGPMQTLLVWLGPINLVIGAFNMIPAFPLDGGRVLRSILWATGHDLRTSTRRVSIVGQLFGWLFVAMGLAMAFGLRVPFFGTGFVSGLWLAFIGWFLHSAASQASMRLAVDDALAGHTVGEVMRRHGLTVPPSLPLATLVNDFFVQSEERALPVVRDGKLVGLVSVSDVRAIPHQEWDATPVERAMRPNDTLVVATPDEPLSEAVEQLARQDVGQLPVLDDGRLVGMLQQSDLTRWLDLTWAPSGQTQSWVAAHARTWPVGPAGRGAPVPPRSH